MTDVIDVPDPGSACGIAVTYCSPVEDTLQAVDRAGAELVVHGHAHGGVEKDMTPGGIHVRNVAQPVIKHAYHV